MDVRDTDNKQAVLEELLEQGMVLVTLDARRDGVDVPSHLANDAQLRLNLSYRFGLPMSLDESGVHATLTFSGSPYSCFLPWAAIYLLVSHVSGRPILFPDDVPSEFFPGAGAGPDVPQIGVTDERDGGGRPRLSLVSGAPDAATSDDASAKGPPKRGHLRVIK